MKFHARRPPFCVIKQCKPVAVHSCTANGHADGNSGFCLGEMKKPEKWKSEAVEHVNDICFCVYTPFKGWVRFVVNDGDLKIMLSLIRTFARKTKRRVGYLDLPGEVVEKEG